MCVKDYKRVRLRKKSVFGHACLSLCICAVCVFLLQENISEHLVFRETSVDGGVKRLWILDIHKT